MSQRTTTSVNPFSIAAAMAKSKADASNIVPITNVTAKNQEKTAKVKNTIPEKTITAYDFMLKEDHDEDFTEAPQVQ